ncbi:MAG: hypothetical protein CVU11_10820 [Bacteroidetes bacterium HGW-Bacteroidetes-6]|jgi:hypothetical protein|nr:MAG: hypothetical protein CVU11_10820 [Bacteroidetes bacterium HGW-Bacteroidetes-6]
MYAKLLLLEKNVDFSFKKVIASKRLFVNHEYKFLELIGVVNYRFLCNQNIRNYIEYLYEFFNCNLLVISKLILEEMKR